MNASTYLRYQVENKIATILIERPDKLNALTRQMAAGIGDLLDRVDTDDAVQCVIISGVGRAFCAGADLSAADTTFANAKMDREDAVDAERMRDYGGRLSLRLFDCLKPVIFAVNGPAIGIGATMTLAGDIRLASHRASFGLPFVRRGIVPDACASWFLPRIVGIGTALEWTMTGRRVTAEEALNAGLARSLHDPDDLLPAAVALAREIVDHAAPVSAALTRQLLWRMLGAAHPMEAHKLESRGIYARARTPDVAEGIASFLEKRPAHFSGRVSQDMPDFFPWWSQPNYE